MWRLGATVLTPGPFLFLDKTIRVWDVETGEPVTMLKGHGNSIRCLKFDQSRLVSGAWVRTTRPNRSGCGAAWLID